MLLDSAINNDVSKIQLALKNNADINAQNKRWLDRSYACIR